MIRDSLALTITSQDLFSNIFIQSGLFEGRQWTYLLTKLAERFALITDHRVEALWGEAIKKPLEEAGVKVALFSLPPGEKSKNRQWKEYLEDQMLEAGLGRDSALIGLGGGVVTDLAGFVAATYCRGIPFISIPTTLLSQVDASLGGKVAVNTSKGKNLIGAFYQPRMVLIDTKMLSTLPHAEYLNGMAEVIKYALITSKSLFEKLSHNPSEEEYILESCAIKMQIVEKDPQEKGLRRILNFGHTVGHALEMAMDYTISHGEAVALGMLVESRWSYKLGYLKEEEFLKIQNLLEKYGFSLKIPSSMHAQDLLAIMCRDKKSLLGKPRSVLLQGIGEVHPFYLLPFFR